MKNTYILKLFFAGNSRGNVKGNREEVVTKNLNDPFQEGLQMFI